MAFDIDDVVVIKKLAKNVAVDFFSSRKEDKSTTSSYLRTFTTTQDKNERPMYCKDKIYCGADEYSFEELRAIRWIKKKEREEVERAEEGMRFLTC